MIIGFDAGDVDFSRYYNLTVNGAATIKLFKNGRVDVKFKDKEKAGVCFRKLRLDTLRLKENG